MKKIILGILVTFFITNSFALTPQQEKIKQTSKEVGKHECVQNFCFGKTLQAIAWVESSFGVNIVGDSKRQGYSYKDKGRTHRVQAKDTFVRKGVRYTLQGTTTRKVHAYTIFKPLNQSSLGPFQIKVTTAKRVIEKMKLTQYYKYLSKEQQLISKLLNDTKFSATIAANYLKLNYIYAMEKGYKNPWKYAVSKYNGGSNNVTYINRIVNKIKLL